MKHVNCISDRIAKEYWRDYQHMVREGNPLGLSYVEYVAQRVLAVFTAYTDTAAAEWHVAYCGHKHPWGESCGTWTMA